MITFLLQDDDDEDDDLEDEDNEDENGDDEEEDDEETETWQVVRTHPNCLEITRLRLTSVLERA